MSKTQTVSIDAEAAEYVAQWSRLPHPLEAAVLHEINDPDDAIHRAADVIHRRPPGVDGPTRSVWVVAQCAPTGEGPRQELSSWCWYATRSAAEAAKAADATARTIVLHETVVPRAVRCDGVTDYLAKNYVARSSDPH